MSGHDRTRRLRLEPSAAPPSVRGEELEIRVTSSFRTFAFVAAEQGLEPRAAVRLAAERALLLGDSLDLGLDVEAARRILNAAARAPRASVALGAEQARLVRSLFDPRPVGHLPLGERLRVRVPEELVARAPGYVDDSAFHARAVPEMLAWERASRLQARSMAEWGLKELAAAVSGR